MLYLLLLHVLFSNICLYRCPKSKEYHVVLTYEDEGSANFIFGLAAFFTLQEIMVWGYIAWQEMMVWGYIAWQE